MYIQRQNKNRKSKNIVDFSGLHLHFWRRKIGDFKLLSVLYEAEIIQSTKIKMLFEI